jgi:type II secretory ATPase GspE/PulE/Tfp pilus assembly ATPase PilB-like protein
MELGNSPYLTADLRKTIEAAYRGGKSLGSSEKETENLLASFISTALSFGTSDIHFQNRGEMHGRIRFRVDGELKDIVDLPPNIFDGLISRFKYITHMKLDHPLPQDGRFATQYEGKEVVIRVSLMPTRLGEDVVMRLLADVSRPKTLEGLGLDGRNLQVIKDTLRRPYGMILVCGPTGSGKTTTVYNMIDQVNRPEVNICTIEDPVEYVLEGVRQMQVNHSVGFDFAKGLRSILRHDPDIVFIGEIRDRETAEIAIDSALTGHQVFSSVHTNNAPEAVSRMRDLGTRPYLLSSILNVIVAQRLAKRLCPDCKVKAKPNPEDVRLVKEEYKIDVSSVEMWEGKGCEKCQGHGYKGRIGVFEVIKVSDSIKELIVESTPLRKIADQARKEGYTTMLEDGLEKIKAGVISLPDLLSITG